MTTHTGAMRLALDALTYRGDYRSKDRHTKKQAAITALRAALDAAQVVPAAPSQSYAEWRDFYESRITQWMTADELRADVGRLSSVDAPSPMLLLVHAMRLLDMPAAPAAPSVPAEPMAWLWQHSDTGRTRVVMPEEVWTASHRWALIGPLYLHPSTATGATQADPLRTAARLVAEATPEQLPMALDALRDHMGAAQEPARAEPQPPALDWPAMLLLLNEYAMHVHDASEHQAESRADISKTAALKTLERIRMALAAHNSRWQALVHELIWRATPAAQDPARVALPADLIEYMRKHLQRERHGLDGFTVLGNETARAERYDRWIAALAGIPGTDGGAA